jgi:predicted DNA-binding ribbon-helix-helix protein
MRSQFRKRSIIINGRKTSVSLEEPFWQDLKAIAVERRTTLSDLFSTIDTSPHLGNLSSMLRMVCMRIPSEGGQ